MMMSKDRPTSAKTRRGNRIYRNRFVHEGELKFAEEYSFAIKKEGERHRLNLGSDLEAAKSMADRIAAFMTVPSHSFRELFEHDDFQSIRKPKKFRQSPTVGAHPLERHSPTVAELLARYQENAVHLSPTTVDDNCNALRHLSAEILGLRPVGKSATKQKRQRWREQVGRLSLEVFTVAELEAIRTRVIRKAGSDGIQRGKAVTTLNSYFRAARSIFAERMMAFYEDFEVPDPNPFKKVRPLREPARRYISRIDTAGIIAKARCRFWDGNLDPEEQERRRELERKRTTIHGRKVKTELELEREDKARFIVLLLTLSCGLRPKEIAKLTWEQVDFANRRVHVAVTSYDTPKARSSESWIDVGQPVLDFLLEFQPLSNLPPFVIPAVRLRGREPRKPAIELFRGLHRWLRQNGVDVENPLYVFRKEAGSIIYEKTDSYDAAADFLRNDPRIAREHYVGRKTRLEIEVPGLVAAASPKSRTLDTLARCEAAGEPCSQVY